MQSIDLTKEEAKLLKTFIESSINTGLNESEATPDRFVQHELQKMVNIFTNILEKLNQKLDKNFRKRKAKNLFSKYVDEIQDSAGDKEIWNTFYGKDDMVETLMDIFKECTEPEKYED